MNEEDLKAFYESYHNKKLTKKDYEQAVREDKWLNEVLDGIETGKNTNWYKAPKKTVQDWRLITKDELLKKHGRGTMWVFVPQAVTHKGTFQEMRVKKINLSYAGKGFTYKHDADVMDLGMMHKDTTRGMWEELVASGEYVEYNENPIPPKNSNDELEWVKNPNYALEA